jgi:hypothetical protein
MELKPKPDEKDLSKFVEKVLMAAFSEDAIPRDLNDLKRLREALNLCIAEIAGDGLIVFIQMDDEKLSIVNQHGTVYVVTVTSRHYNPRIPALTVEMKLRVVPVFGGKYRESWELDEKGHSPDKLTIKYLQAKALSVSQQFDGEHAYVESAPLRSLLRGWARAA